MFKRFNTSNSRDYNNNDTYNNGELTWNDNVGLRLHDGYTPGGDPLLSVHNWTDYIATAIGQAGPNTIVFNGDVTGSFYVGFKFYLVGDSSETQYTVDSRTYDSGSGVTFVVTTSNFNITPRNGTIVYRTINKDNINQLAAGDGVTLEQSNKKLTVKKQYSGQETINVTEQTTIDGITKTEITSSFIVVRNDSSWSGTTDQFLQLPYGFDQDIPLGTQITVYNAYTGNLLVAGWAGGPGGAFTLASGANLNLTYIEYDYGAGPERQWWATGTFAW